MKFADATTSKPAGSRGLLWNMLCLVWGGVLLAAMTYVATSTIPTTQQESTALAFDASDAAVFSADDSAPLGKTRVEPPPAPQPEPFRAVPYEFDARINPNYEPAVVATSRRTSRSGRQKELTAEQVGERYAQLRDAYAEEVSNRFGSGRRYSAQYHVDRPRPTLDWLKDHQNPEGFWSAARHGDDSTRTYAFRTACVDAGEVSSAGATFEDDVAVTALALLAYVGAGYDHKEGDFRASCRQCILWLRKITNDDGSINAVYSICTYAWVAMAWCECYGLSGDQVLKPLADRAVKHVMNRQRKGSGWGVDVQQEPDLLSTAIAILALKSAKMSGLEFDAELAYAGANAFLDSVAEDGYGPLEAACWIMATLFTGHTDLNDERIKERAKLLARDENLPKWEAGRIDFLYWWMGSMALYYVGGEQWKKWEKAVSTTLLDHQRGYHAKDKAESDTSKQLIVEHGSWDAVDPWNTQGRVFTTAVAGLTLDVYYRYLRLSDE